MNLTRFALALALVFSPLPVLAQANATATDYARARAVVADLQRIVSPEGVQDTYKTTIGGIPQWISVRGQDRGNPVILFLHGGPATPQIPSLWQFQRPLEEYFTMVNYDQRGAGKTFLETDPERIKDTMNVQTFVDDAIEIAEHVRKRLGKDKVILMAHSWGSIVGMRAALQRPDLFHAYVGIGQVINTLENERLSVEYGLRIAREQKNAEAIREIESISPYPGDKPLTRDRIVMARKWPQHYGGLSAFRSTSTYYFGAARLSPDYSAEDRQALDTGSLFTLDKVIDEFLATDFRTVREFPIPVVMLMGRHDYTTPSAPTAEWLDRVKAPYKQGVWFEHSAHMAPWEEPGKTLVSLLQHVRPLASEPVPKGRP
ncbi:alpha/beta fold hydrolase [Lysobacter olei]